MTGGSVAYLDNELPLWLEREILVERGNAEQPCLSDPEPLCDVREHLFRQVAVVLLNSLKDRDDVLLLAADAVDDLVDLVELNGALHKCTSFADVRKYTVSLLCTVIAPLI